MRLEGQSKMGYYPTPELTLQHLTTYFALQGASARLYDPTCGRGEALRAIANALGLANVETFGTELSELRANYAAQVLNHVICTAYEYMQLTRETFNFILLNPPYDGETETGGGKRLEESMLVDFHTTDLLTINGVLVYIIPHNRINERIARHLGGWYTDLRCYKMPGSEYDVFKQIVIIGRRKNYEASADATRQVLTWAKGQYIASEETVEEYSIPLKFMDKLKELTGKDRPTTVSFVDGFPVVMDGASEEAYRWADQVRPFIHDKLASGDLKLVKRTTTRPIYASLNELTPCSLDNRYLIPETPLRGRGGAAFKWQYAAVSDEDLAREAERAAAQLDTTNKWISLAPATEPEIITPAMTPKNGHIALLVSGGVLGTNKIVDPADGKSVLLKGHVIKTKVRVTQTDDDSENEQDYDFDNKSKKAFHKHVIRDVFQTVLNMISEAGNFASLTKPEEIAPVLERFVSPLADIVRKRNAPRYDMQPEQWELAALAPLSPNRMIVGRDEAGLTMFQKHIVIAIGRLAAEFGVGFINAEMGSGKTTMGIAVAAYLAAAAARSNSKQRNPYPVLVVGPGIVTGKTNWPQEIKDVQPNSASTVIDIGARPVPKGLKLGDYVEKCGIDLDQPSFEGKDGKFVFQAIQAAAKNQNKSLSSAQKMAIRYTIKEAANNPPDRRRGAEKPNLLDARVGGYLWMGMGDIYDSKSESDIAGKASMAEFISKYRAGELPERSFAIISYETAKLAAGRQPAVNYRNAIVKVREINEKTGQAIVTRTIVKRACCPECGSFIVSSFDEEDGTVKSYVEEHEIQDYIGSKRQFCQAERPRWIYNHETGKKEKKVIDADGNPYQCGAPLFSLSMYRRIPAVEYVKQKAKDLFGVVLVDEVHKAKAKGTGVGWVLSVLKNLSQYSIGLTGTLIGGYSTNIFWLFHRFISEVRHNFGFNDETDWVHKYGLLERTIYSNDAKFTEDGSFVGTKFSEIVKEKPGISPAIAALGLKYVTFSSLPDMGLPLPAYSEEIVRVPMTKDMKLQMLLADGTFSASTLDIKEEDYDSHLATCEWLTSFGREIPKNLYDWALRRKSQETGGGAIGVWVNTALNRPDAMFRKEIVDFTYRQPRDPEKPWKKRVKNTDQILHLNPVPGLGYVDNETGKWVVQGLLPKEERLANICLSEKYAGRKVLVYVRQTGTRDIQDRLVAALETKGLKVGVLSPTITPAKRAEWMKKSAAKYDVMLTNARLVEVGLNLTMFSTAVFYELEWSLYIIWQAMRRLYRPGAPLPVKLYFMVYENTLEETALDMIGAKMMAAQVFYGDEISGALSDETDNGNLLNDIVRKAMGELKVGRAEGIFSKPFTDNAVYSESPMGNPTIKSVRVVTLDDLRAKLSHAKLKSVTKKKLTVNTSQMTLFN